MDSSLRMPEEIEVDDFLHDLPENGGAIFIYKS